MEDKKVSAKKKLFAQYRTVFGTPEGKAVLRDMTRAGFLSFETSPFVPGQPDTTAKNLGKQEFVKEIFYILKLNPDEFLKQMEEKEASHV